jgi:hypothetical protein
MYLINNRRLQVHKDSPWDMFAGASLGEEGVEGVIRHSQGVIVRHHTVRVDPMLQAVKLPGSQKFRLFQTDIIFPAILGDYKTKPYYHI